MGLDGRRRDVRDGGEEPRAAAPPRAGKWLDRAEFFFGWLVLFSGVYYLTREAKTDAQWYFRVGSFFAGAVGWVVVQFLKRGR